METKSAEVTSPTPQISASRTFIYCVGQMVMLNYERSYLEFSDASVQGYRKPSAAVLAMGNEHLRVWTLLVHGGAWWSVDSSGPWWDWLCMHPSLQHAKPRCSLPSRGARTQKGPCLLHS